MGGVPPRARRGRGRLTPPSSAHTLVVGAGIVGVAVANALAERGVEDILVVDERAPLSLTSAVSTECYRDWWPSADGAMVHLMSRSIDLLEELVGESGNAFRMNRRGYLFATADARRVDEWTRAMAQMAAHDAGPTRCHTGSRDDPPYVPSPARGLDRSLRGADLVTDRPLIEQRFPYLAPEVVAVLHARRAGWLSAQRLGTYLLERAQARGARLLRGRLEGITVREGGLSGARVDGRTIAVERVVIAAGPHAADVAGLVGVELPIACEPHTKVAFHDELGAVPRDAPFCCWTDPQRLPWSYDEARELLRGPARSLVDDTFPAGPHGRPEGDGDAVLMLWSYDGDAADPHHAEIVLRGWSAMLPGLRAYFSRLPRPAIDGGYYARTPENRPLIGPLPVRGVYVVGALSGFGIMAACGAADLVVRHMLEEDLPAYAPAFVLERYADPRYRELMREMASGQL